MSDITTDDIKYIAELSKLELTDAEIQKFQSELSEIIGYVEQLGDADLDGKEITHQVSGLVDQMRQDKAVTPQSADNSLQRVDRGQLLANTADSTNNGYIKVNRVL